MRRYETFDLPLWFIRAWCNWRIIILYRKYLTVIVIGATCIAFVASLISQIKGFRQSNRYKGIISVGNAFAHLQTIGSRCNNVLLDTFRWPEDEYISCTYARTRVVELICPCDSRQSKEGHRTPPPSSPYLFLTFVSSVPLIGSFTTCTVATHISLNK